MGLQELECISCGAPILAGNVNLDRGLAKCSHCGAIFTITHDAQPTGNVPPVQRPPQPEPIDVPMPARFRVEDLGGTLTIEYNWWTPAILFLVFFAVLWNGFMIGWHTIALSTGAWFMSAFGLLHTAVGVGLIYVCLACILNTTTIRVDTGELSIRHKPMPWRGNRSLNSRDIQQLYVKSHVSHSKNGSTTTYQLHAVMSDGRREKLLTGLSEQDQALYLEQEIERHLRIEDAPVRGEIPR
jgi:hypothetical protein